MILRQKRWLTSLQNPLGWHNTYIHLGFGSIMSEEMSEVDMMRQVATDRLVYMRVMEKAINEIDIAVANLKRDIMEISQQVANRNTDMTMVQEDEEVSESDE